MLAAGTTLGPYEILASLGAGGMGEVYRAHDPRLGRDVAIKVLSAHLAATPEARTRFELEARTVSRLTHPHICTLYDVGHEDGTSFLVMELLEGETLARRLRKGALPLADVLTIGLEIAEALDRAHRAGVVHRDLKPGNVMLTRSGAKLMDFGLARSPGPAPAPQALSQSPTVSAPLTAEGAIVGTFEYMAPEQLEGKEADPRSDVWALGCVLYEMATGVRAFEGDSRASLIAAILDREPRPLPELRPAVPPALERVVHRCLRKHPDDRFQNASDLAFDLESLSTWPAAGAVPAAPPAPATGMHRAWAIAGAAALLALAFTAGHFAWRSAPAQPAFQRLTFRRGTISTARFTPDGRTVVHDARWDGAPSRIFTLRPGNPESRSLGIDDARLLAVSSRGELAIQLRPRMWAGRSRGTLARVPLEGGAPRAVRDHVLAADWTTDGSQFALAPSDSPLSCIEMPPATTVARAMAGLDLMRIAPDGRRVAYWRTAVSGVGGELALAGPRAPERVLCRIDFRCTGLAWNPRTRELWYSEADTAGSTFIRAVSASGRRRPIARVAGLATLEDIASGGDVLISLRSSRSVMQVLVPGQTEEGDLSWLDGSAPDDLSPDATMLVFQESGVAGGRGTAMYLRMTDGSPAVRLGEGANGALSPDRKWVAVWVRAARPRIRLLPVGAGEAYDVATADVVPTASLFFFPDGKRMLFQGRRGAGTDQMFAVPVAGGTPRPITPLGWSHWAGQRPISPDGRWVATIDPEGVNYIVPAEGGAPRAVPGVAAGEVVLGWTADSGGLYVFQRGEVPARIHRLEIATGRRQPWREIGPRDRAGVSLVSYVLITPDGRGYAYSFERTQDDLYLVRGLR